MYAFAYTTHLRSRNIIYVAQMWRSNFSRRRKYSSHLTNPVFNQHKCYCPLCHLCFLVIHSTLQHTTLSLPLVLLLLLNAIHPPIPLHQSL